MFPSLRFMFAAVLSTLVILVIASSTLISVRRPNMPAVVLHPTGSRPLAASWLTDDMQSFEARFGPHVMMINASVQLPPKDLNTDHSRPARIEFVASANAASDPTKSGEPAKHSDKIIPIDMAATPTVIEPAEEPLSIAPPITAAPPTELPAEPLVVVAIEPAPVPAKDPQIASDAPAQLGERIAVAPTAAPAAERPTFSDTSRTEPIVKPAIKRRAQIKRPKKRVVRAAARPSIAKPNIQAPTNPFAALFGSTNAP